MLLQQEETSLLYAQGCSGGWGEEGDTEDRNLLVCFYCIYSVLEAGDNLVYKIVQKEAQTITRPIQLRYIDLPILNKGQKLRKKKFFLKDTDKWSSKKAVPIDFHSQYVYVCICMHCIHIKNFDDYLYYVGSMQLSRKSLHFGVRQHGLNLSSHHLLKNVTLTNQYGHVGMCGVT